MRCSLVVIVIMLSAIPGRALTLSGHATTPGGAGVKVVIKFKDDLPKDIRLNYAPTFIPSNQEYGFAFETTYNGVEGYEYESLLNQSETLASILNFHDLKFNRDNGDIRKLRGKVDRNETSIVRWSESTVTFHPSDGGPTIITQTDSTPKVIPTNEQSRQIAGVTSQGSLERSLTIEFYGDFFARFLTPSSIEAIFIRIRHVGPKQWRMSVSTVRVYRDTDTFGTLSTIDRGSLRAR